MCVWAKELRQAFQEAIIRGNPFTVLEIRDRVRELFSAPRTLENCVAMDLRPVTQTVDSKSVKQELLALVERERPSKWAVITIPVVDEDGNPQNVWQFTPFSAMETTEQANLARLVVKPSLFRRFLDWVS